MGFCDRFLIGGERPLNAGAPGSTLRRRVGTEAQQPVLGGCVFQSVLQSGCKRILDLIALVPADAVHDDDCIFHGSSPSSNKTGRPPRSASPVGSTIWPTPSLEQPSLGAPCCPKRCGCS